VAREKVYYKGMASPKSRLWWVLCVRGCPWFVRAPKVLKLCTNRLLFGLCRSVWVIELLVNLLILILELQHAPLPPKCWVKERTPTPSTPIVFTFGLVVNPSRCLGVRHIWCQKKTKGLGTNVVCEATYVPLFPVIWSYYTWKYIRYWWRKKIYKCISRC
jgi:hypothetical protein